MALMWESSMKLFNLKPISLGVFFLLAFLFSGCSMKSDFNVNLPKDYKIKQQLNYKPSYINVQIASEKEKTGDLDIFETNFTTLFEDSLKKVFKETKIFNDDSDNNIKIKVLVLKIDGPAVGFSMTVYADVLYTIQDKNANVIYTKTISTAGVAGAGEAFMGIERYSIANNRAVQNNIKAFIDDLQEELK